MEKLNAIYTDPNQHSSRKTKYQHQKLKKKTDGSRQWSERHS